MRGLSRDPGRSASPTARDMALALEEAMPARGRRRRSARGSRRRRPETLDERNERIASIESNSSLHAPPDAQPPRIASPPAAAPAPAPAVEEVHTQLSSGSVSAPGRAPRTSPLGGRRLLFVAAGGGALAVALLVGFSMRGGTGSVPGIPAAAPPASPAAVLPAAEPAPTAPAPDPAPPAIAPVTSSLPAASVPRTPPRRPSVPAARPPATRRPGTDDGTADRK